MSSVPTLHQLREVALAVRSLATCTSEGLGRDCILHALLAQHLLRQEGFTAELAAGHAAWRIGAHPAAVVAHHPGGDCAEDQGVLFHAWLEIDARRWLFDPTAYLLPAKIRALDAADGVDTPIELPEEWREFVLVRERDLVSWTSIRDGRAAGLCHYRVDRELLARVRRHPDSRLDPAAAALVTNIHQAIRRRQPLRLRGPCGSVELDFAPSAHAA